MSARGLVVRGVPPLPKAFVYVVGLIMLLSIIILALAAYAKSLSGDYYYDSAIPGFLLFVSVWTWFIYGGMLALGRYAPRLYYRLGVLVGQLLSTVFWIVGWAWAASWAAYVLSFDNYGSYDNIRGAWKAYGQTTAACAGIGALVWALCMLALGIFSSVCMRSVTSAQTHNIELVDASKLDRPQGQTVSPPSQVHANQHFYAGDPSFQPSHGPNP
ncbi:hypothetical protein F5Y14DRAFT_172759 [Nemania sp. NC0429]|nr:hypothetical protein F5Y14DRAFT_172759 [Nemania sp. NC0429]